jgi:DNA replication protein DnaC
VEKWYQYLAQPTLADAILDRLVHNSHRLSLKGESMRAKRATHPTNDVDNTMTEN